MVARNAFWLAKKIALVRKSLPYVQGPVPTLPLLSPDRIDYTRRFCRTLSAQTTLLEQPGFRFRRPYLEPRAKRTTWIVRKKMAKSRKIERCLM